jgi:hypothetical protein
VARLDFDRHDFLLGAKVLGVELEEVPDIGLDADDQQVGLLVGLLTGEIQPKTTMVDGSLTRTLLLLMSINTSCRCIIAHIEAVNGNISNKSG